MAWIARRVARSIRRFPVMAASVDGRIGTRASSAGSCRGVSPASEPNGAPSDPASGGGRLGRARSADPGGFVPPARTGPSHGDRHDRWPRGMNRLWDRPGDVTGSWDRSGRGVALADDRPGGCTKPPSVTPVALRDLAGIQWFASIGKRIGGIGKPSETRRIDFRSRKKLSPILRNVVFSLRLKPAPGPW